MRCFLRTLSWVLDALWHAGSHVKTALLDEAKGPPHPAFSFSQKLSQMLLGRLQVGHDSHPRFIPSICHLDH